MSFIKNSNLLVVDDELPILRFVQKILENSGHYCVTAKCTDEAKELMKKHSFNLIITDLKMPGESGVDLLKYSAEHYPLTGRIMMTGFNTLKVAKEVLDIGVYGYLLKPLDRDLLLITVQNALRQTLLENQMQACLEETKKEVIEKNETLEIILNNIDIGVAVLDQDLSIITQNQQIGSMFPEPQVDGRPSFFELLKSDPPENLSHDCLIQNVLDTRQPAQMEKIRSTESGPKEYNISILPFKDQKGLANKVLLLFQDVTDIIEAQRTLSESNKLAAVGQLASGIAHEINTPTQYLGDNVNFLQDAFADMEILFSMLTNLQRVDCSDEVSLPKGWCTKIQQQVSQADVEFLAEEIPAALKQSNDGVKRISEIVKAMKDFSHPGEDEKTPSNINELIKNTLTVCKNEWKYVAETQLHLDEALPMVECFPNEISQVLLILIVNGAHSIEEKMGRNNNSMGEIHMTTSKQQSGHIHVLIRDTGKGIAQENKHKIFQPFFTTKQRGKGTGQGLALAKKIITEKHEGALTFTSEIDIGTEFSIQLPIKSP